MEGKTPYHDGSAQPKPYTPEEDKAYVQRIAHAQYQHHWWAEQILHHDRQRRGYNSPLDRWITEQIAAGHGTPELQSRGH